MPFHTVVQEKKLDLLALIIDKSNLFAESIASKLDSGITPVIVSDSVKKNSGKSILLSTNRAFAQMPEGTYSHIFYVWEDEKVKRESARRILEKVKSTETKILCIVPYDITSQKLNALLKQFPQNSYVIIYAELFGGGRSWLDNLVTDAIDKNRVVLPYAQEKEIVIFNYDDTVEGILSIAFAQHNAGKFFLAYSNQPYTILGLFHLLQQRDPLLKIDFSQAKKNIKEKLMLFYSDSTEVYLFSSDFSVLDKFVKLYEKKLEKKQYPKDFSLTMNKGKTTKIKISNLTSPKNRILFSIYALIVLIIFPFLATFFFSVLGFFFLYCIKYEVEHKSYNEIQITANAAAKMFEISLLGMPLTIQEARLLGIHNVTLPLEEVIQQGSDLAKIVSNVGTIKELINLSGSSKNINKNILANIPISLQEALFYGEDAMARSSPLTKMYTQLALHYFQTNSGIINLLNAFPAFWNTNGKQTFIILFQNNMELRPGGGFIGSYGLLTIDKGKASDFHIEDVYDADGQLKGHVEPPFFIRRYLPIPHLYLRDSNYDVDFIRNAVSAATLFQEERGVKINGVLAVDLSFFKNLLQETGPIYVPNYNETVDKNNFFLITEKHVESNFFPGSSQKSDFLHALFQALEDKLRQSPPSIPSLFLLLRESILEKHLMLSSIDLRIQNIFFANGMSSSLADKRIDSPGVINDFLGLSEANLGANKVNYFIKRNISQTVYMSFGTLGEKIKIEFDNNSDGSWPGGVYKNYFRIIVPKGAILDSVSVDSKNQDIVPAVTDFNVYEAKGFIPPVGFEVNKSSEQGKTLFGFLINVPSREKRVIEINYHFPFSEGPNGLVYNLKIFKQPGVDIYPYSFVLNSGDYNITQSSEKLIRNGNFNEFSKDIESDEDISIHLRK